LWKALLGFNRTLAHLDGHVVNLSRRGVTQPGAFLHISLPSHKAHFYTHTGFVQTIKGEGMPFFEQPSRFGDLFVEYNVVLPSELTSDMHRSTFIIIYINDALTVVFILGLAEAFHSSQRPGSDEL
jgi:DnaJ-related protein SCJ1